jgi:hypothetical protein
MSTPPKTLSADAFLSYKPKEKVVSIPSLGGKIKVRQMLAADQEFVASKINDDSTVIDAQVWLVIRCAVEPSFTEENFDQLKNLPAETLSEIDAAIEEASGGKVASAKEAEKSDLAES